MSTNEFTDRYSEIKSRLRQFAENNKEVHAVIAIGSSTRTDLPADKYSDLDVIIVTEEPDGWYSGEYSSLLGKVSISFIEPTLGGGKERRCIFDEDKDVDMLIFTPEQFDKALSDGAAQWVMNRGYEIIFDRAGYSESVGKYVKPVVNSPKMTEAEFANIVGNFYFHIIWGSKKLLRGELWSAVICVNSYLKSMLLKMIEQYHIAASDTDVWHDGRFLDRWAEPEVLNALSSCFSHYDNTDCENAIKATHALFAKLSRAVAEKRGYNYPYEAESCAARFLKEQL
ncbi:MAG: aminoglycoside 6-adenylyltransferase [Ruminococcus sp.]|nr:aminoglycoside 6-adenylyltransferase [Ruminococcus sp.]